SCEVEKGRYCRHPRKQEPSGFVRTFIDRHIACPPQRSDQRIKGRRRMNPSSGAPGLGDLTIACDVGGTFTDLIVQDDRGLELFKVASTPDNPIPGIISALDRASNANGAPDLRALLARCKIFIHATTRATNALLTGGTAKTAFLTTQGHRDILLLREG